MKSDEATYALDSQSEAIVQKAINNLMQEKLYLLLCIDLQQSKMLQELLL